MIWFAPSSHPAAAEKSPIPLASRSSSSPRPKPQKPKKKAPEYFRGSKQSFHGGKGKERVLLSPKSDIKGPIYPIGTFSGDFHLKITSSCCRREGKIEFQKPSADVDDAIKSLMGTFFLSLRSLSLLKLTSHLQSRLLLLIRGDHQGKGGGE